MPTKMSQTLTLDRQCDFQILTIGPSHCGTLTNEQLPVRYSLLCECENVLDARGFLFEQVGVDNFFHRMKSTTLSCEKLTISCCKKLVALIRKDNPACKIRSITLKLSPWPYAASMTYTVKPS